MAELDVGSGVKMSSDLFESVKRAREELGKSQSGPDAEDRDTNLDLGDEKIAAGLEDSQLVSHMDAARRRLKEHEARMAQTPKLAPLLMKKTELFGKLSTVTKAVPDKRQEQGTAADHVCIQTRRIREVLAGTPPRDFEDAEIEDEDARAFLTKACTDLGKAGDELQKHHEYLRTLAAELSQMRIMMIDVCDGLQKRCEDLEEERQYHRELLRGASDVYNAHQVKLHKDISGLGLGKNKKSGKPSLAKLEKDNSNLGLGKNKRSGKPSLANFGEDNSNHED